MRSGYRGSPAQEGQVNWHDAQAVEKTKHHNTEEHFEKYSEDFRRRKRKNDHAKERTESCKKRNNVVINRTHTFSYIQIFFPFLKEMNLQAYIRIIIRKLSHQHSVLHKM